MINMKMTNKNGIVYLEEGKIELFTPQKYMEQKIANINGNDMVTLGIMPYKYYAKSTDTKPTHVGIFNEPTIVTFFPTDVEQNVEDGIWDGIYNYTNTNTYTKMIFESGYKLYDSCLIKSLNNVTLYADLFLGGKLDNNIPYQYISPAFFKNMQMNNVDLAVPCTVVQLMAQELCRSATDPKKRFADIIGRDPKVSPVAYRYASIRQICASNSVFSALAFEDMNAMLDSSLNMTAEERTQKKSPLEQILYM